MRRTALALAVVVIAAFATATPAGAAASITVTPSTDLVSGQTVSVSGSGFAANASLASAQCKASIVSTDDCDISHALFVNADATGAYAFTFTVRSVIGTFNGTVDCAASDGACVLGVAQTSDILGTAVTAPLSFTPLGPPERGVIVGPSAPTGAGQSASIEATEFTPFTVLGAAVCKANPADANDCESAFEVNAAAAGAANFELFAYETAYTQNGDTIDCTVDGACVYAAWDSRAFIATLATAPVRIAPAVAGTLTVEPSTDLQNGQDVAVSGTGWPADTVLRVTQCDGAHTDATCIHASYFETDGDGAFSMPYPVFSAVDPGIDCETGPCWIQAQWSAPEKLVAAAAQISFDVTPTPVTSHYTNAELAAVGGAATTLAISNAEVQHVGPWALAWVLGITGTGIITPVPDTGPGSITTTWMPSEYTNMTAAADAHGASLAEFQKTGALFLAYVLAL